MHDPLRPHRHENNSNAPDDDSSLVVHYAGRHSRISLERLQAYPSHILSYRYQTDHGTHGPYRLEGVRIIDLISTELGDCVWEEIEVISADGFGNRIDRTEFSNRTEPIMLCYKLDGELLSRQAGLVRLLVPSESNNALRQVKWVRDIKVLTSPRC